MRPTKRFNPFFLKNLKDWYYPRVLDQKSTLHSDRKNWINTYKKHIIRLFLAEVKKQIFIWFSEIFWITQVILFQFDLYQVNVLVSRCHDRFRTQENNSNGILLSFARFL